MGAKLRIISYISITFSTIFAAILQNMAFSGLTMAIELPSSVKPVL